MDGISFLEKKIYQYSNLYKFNYKEREIYVLFQLCKLKIFCFTAH